MTVYQRSISASIDPVKLDRLAELATKVGLQLKAGQDLLVTAPTAALPLVRKVAEHAYRVGAGLVTPILSDETVTLARYRYAPDDGFDRAAGWLYDGMSKAFAANTARLAVGGASTAKNGITCNPNIPTEEVFTTPHARRVSGHVVSTKPLSYQGSLIDGIAVRFEEGCIVAAKAARGEEVLNKVLDTDEGARRLGEVALVPHSSPISKSGLLFFNTLFDENAACHIALGQCYSKCFLDGANLTPQQIAAKGGNKSLIHIDWMIGSDKTDIDGIRADGSCVPVFRKGEWA